MLTTKYQKPAVIPNDMGGTETVLDDRLATVIEVLKETPLETLQNFLDIGMGKGQIAKWIRAQGKSVTGIGLEIGSYGENLAQLKNDFGIKITECTIEKIPFPTNSFDGIILSHVLEHCPNVGLALQEVRRVLSDNGCLFIFVPPVDNNVCAGHISVGWNVGQLIYVLLINGFNVKQGSFIEYGYNVVGIVKKHNSPLPPIRGDRGDIHILNKNGLFPLPVVTKDGYNDNYFGKIKAINWNPASPLLVYHANPIKKVIIKLLMLLPKTVKTSLVKTGVLLDKVAVNNVINPPALKG